MPVAQPPLELSVAGVSKLLDIPVNSINAWRNLRAFPLGKAGEGPRAARRYAFGDIFALAITRRLTAGPAGLSFATAAKLAPSCRRILVEELAGAATPGRFLVLVGGSAVAEVPVAAADLAAYVADWSVAKVGWKFERLEILDVRSVAILTLARVLRLPGQGLEDATEIKARGVAEAEFEERASGYLREEIDQFRGERT